MGDGIIDENERVRIDAINRVKQMQSLDVEKQILLRIEEDPKVKENYEIFKTQCKIDELLNRVVKYVKDYREGQNLGYKPNQKITFEELVDEEDFVNFAMQNIIPIISTEVVDSNDIEKLEERNRKRLEIATTLHKCNIEELRTILYYCYSIKPVPFPKLDYGKTIDVPTCFAAGVNPEALTDPNASWFLEEKDYKYMLNNDLREIIIRGTVLGASIGTKELIKEERSPKKY